MANNRLFVFIILMFILNISFSFDKLNWDQTWYQFEGKNIDFNDKMLIFAGQGYKRKGDIIKNLEYKNISKNCVLIIPKVVNFDLEIRVYLKNGSYKRLYYSKFCTGAEFNAVTECTDDKCYVFASCIYNGTKVMCNNTFPEDINVTNRSLTIFEFDPKDPFNPKVILNKTGFKFNDESPELECNNKGICFLENSPYLGPGGYILSLNVPNNIVHKKFNFNYDSIYLISKDDYIYTNRGKLYYNDHLIGAPGKRIFGCVIYNESIIYCIMDNNRLDGALYEINIKNYNLKKIKDFSGYGYFSEFVNGFIANNTVVFVIMSNDINEFNWWYFTYNPIKKYFKIILADKSKPDMINYQYYKYKFFKLINNSVVEFKFDINNTSNNIALGVKKNPVFFLKYFNVSDLTNKKWLRTDMIPTFGYKVTFEGYFSKIPVFIYLNGKLILSKNVSSGEIVEFMRKFNTSKNITIKFCYLNNSNLMKCLNYSYHIKKVINKTKNNSNKKEINNETNNSLNKPFKDFEDKDNINNTEKKGNNYLFIILIIIFLIIIILFFIRQYRGVSISKKDEINWGD